MIPGTTTIPLDHLPPLGLPGEVTNAEATSAAPSAFVPEGKPGDRSLPGESGGTDSAAAAETVKLSPKKAAEGLSERGPGGRVGDRHRPVCLRRHEARRRQHAVRRRP